MEEDDDANLAWKLHLQYNSVIHNRPRRAAQYANAARPPANEAPVELVKRSRKGSIRYDDSDDDGVSGGDSDGDERHSSEQTENASDVSSVSEKRKSSGGEKPSMSRKPSSEPGKPKTEGPRAETDAPQQLAKHKKKSMEPSKRPSAKPSIGQSSKHTSPISVKASASSDGGGDTTAVPGAPVNAKHGATAVRSSSGQPPVKRVKTALPKTDQDGQSIKAKQASGKADQLHMKRKLSSGSQHGEKRPRTEPADSNLGKGIIPLQSKQQPQPRVLLEPSDMLGSSKPFVSAQLSSRADASHGKPAGPSKKSHPEAALRKTPSELSSMVRKPSDGAPSKRASGAQAAPGKRPVPDSAAKMAQTDKALVTQKSKLDGSLLRAHSMEASYNGQAKAAKQPDAVKVPRITKPAAPGTEASSDTAKGHRPKAALAARSQSQPAALEPLQPQSSTMPAAKARKQGKPPPGPVRIKSEVALEAPATPKPEPEAASAPKAATKAEPAGRKVDSRTQDGCAPGRGAVSEARGAADTEDERVQWELARSCASEMLALAKVDSEIDTEGKVKCFFKGQRYGIWLPHESIATRTGLATALNDAYAGSIRSCGRGDRLSVIFIDNKAAQHVFPPARKQNSALADQGWPTFSQSAVRVLVDFVTGAGQAKL